ncbi:MAG: ABC transporter ATP-binding protein [Eubacteriaceae bacterium]|nr:ABC transporter ATP-binding protein [Eubacteriaceae bacterium]
MLKIENLSITLEDKLVLDNISCEIPVGSVACIIGSSGIGKTTLLKTIGGIIKPQTGNITLNQRVINSNDVIMGYVPQDHGLYPWMRVRTNLLLPFKIKKLPIDPVRLGAITAKLGITDLMGRYPSLLSGGEKQRVALARGMILNPEILLMDEAFSSLDAFSKDQSRELFIQLQEMFKPTALLVTHDIDEALILGDNILVLTGDNILTIKNKAKSKKKWSEEYASMFETLDGLVRGKIGNE